MDKTLIVRNKMNNSMTEFGGNHYKAAFKYEADANYQNTLNNKKALLAISVGQSYHEEGKFIATIELINKQMFKQCDIVLGDTLQRYNCYGRMNPEEALIYCKEQGDQWLKRNAYALSILNVPHSIIRWDELLSHKCYEKNKKNIMDTYHNDCSYKKALHDNVETYLDRLKALNPESDETLLFSWGLQYLLEECPVIMPLWAEMGYDFIIYPKPLTVGMAKTRELFVNGKFDDKCQWLSLRFKRRSQNSSVHKMPIYFDDSYYSTNFELSRGAK